MHPTLEERPVIDHRYGCTVDAYIGLLLNGSSTHKFFVSHANVRLFFVDHRNRRVCRTLMQASRPEILAGSEKKSVCPKGILAETRRRRP